MSFKLGKEVTKSKVLDGCAKKPNTSWEASCVASELAQKVGCSIKCAGKVAI